MIQRQNKTLLLRSLLLLFLLLSLALGTASAQAVNRLWITAVDASAFPDVMVRFVAQGPNGQAITDFSSLQLQEDGSARDNVTIDRPEVGIEVLFVIDANETITDDDGTDTSRRDDVVEAINLFVDNFMDPNQVDRVTIVVPPDDDYVDGLLTQEAIFINEVKNQINFYNPDPDDPAPLNDMMFQALDLAAGSQDHGLAQVILLFSDGALDDEPLDFDGIVGRANDQHVTIFAAILGERDDPDEIANMQQLYEPTNGAYVHMPDAESLEPVLTTIDELSFQNQASYRSSLNSNGEHTIRLNLAGTQAEANFNITVEPPEVNILIDNSQPIIRVAADAETPLAEMAPTEQLVVAQVSFPDDQPRAITAVNLSVNGRPVPLPDDVAPDADGIIEFNWELSDVDAGTYNLVLTVTDELGLEGENAPLPLTVEVDRPEAVVETDEPDAETEDVEDVVEDEVEPEAQGGFLEENLGFIGLAGGVVAIGVAFFILILAVVLVRRRNRPAVSEQPVVPTVAQAKPTANMEADSTQIISPDFVLQQSAGAYLEVMEHAPEHQGPIFIPGKNAAFGRDERVAQIVFKDKSVSRLHARIMENGGVYRLYDEGSASGTYHNFERVSLTPHTLQDNDDVHFGRVHLKFHLGRGGQGGAADDDSTQIFGPGGAPMRPAVAGGEDTSTQVFNPHDAGPSGRGSAQPSRPSDEDPDDTSTQPFMPHH